MLVHAGQLIIQGVNFTEAVFLIVMLMVIYAIFVSMVYMIAPYSFRKFVIGFGLFGAMILLTFSSLTFVVYNPVVENSTTTLITTYVYGNYTSTVSYPVTYDTVASYLIIASLIVAILLATQIMKRMVYRR